MRLILVPILASAVALAAVLAACGSSPVQPQPARAKISVAPQLAMLDEPEVHRLIKLSDNIYSG